MYFKSKKVSLIVLGITSLVCSRAMFLFFNDSEGPNLLVVAVAAVIVFAVSAATYLLPETKSFSGFKKLLCAILVQLVVVVGGYLLLK